MDLFGTVLLPIVGLAAGGFVVGYASTPVNPARMRNPRLNDVLVSIAGPTANLVLCLAAIGIGRLVSTMSALRTGGVAETAFAMLTTLALLNAFLFIFNLLPVPPLDGSRVVRSVISDQARDSYDRFARMGLMLVFVAVYYWGAYVFVPVSSAIKAAIGGT